MDQRPKWSDLKQLEKKYRTFSKNQYGNHVLEKGEEGKICGYKY